MTEFYIKGSCNTITGFFSIQNRLTFEGTQETPSSKQGIRYHNFIIAFILRIFSDKKIVSIKDIDGKIYHINRGSLSDWLRKNHDDLKSASKEGMLNVTEHAMRRWLDEVLAKKSPQYIVKISAFKNDLRFKENQKKQGDKNGWDSIAHRRLPDEIANLKRQLAEAEAEAERLKNK